MTYTCSVLKLEIIYQVAYSMSDFCKLSDEMGCKWEIRPHVEGDPCSFFQYVSSVVVYLDKPNILKVKFKYAGSSFPVCDDYRERCMVSAAARSQSFLNETADDTLLGGNILQLGGECINVHLY